MAIYLIRHGETAGNAARIVQLPEIPLNDNGHDQARRVAERMAALNITGILSSDYQRTHSTAQAISTRLGLPVELNPLLRERHFGDHRGTAMAEIGFNIFAEEHEPPNGESWAVFRERVAQAWQSIQAAAANTSGDLAVVTHGLVLRVIADRVIPLATGVNKDVSIWANTCVTIVEPRPDWSITRLACAEHLEPGGHITSGPVGI